MALRTFDRLNSESSGNSLGLYGAYAKRAAEDAAKVREANKNSKDSQDNSTTTKPSYEDPFQILIDAVLTSNAKHAKSSAGTDVQSKGNATSIGSGFSNKYDSKILQYANKYNIDPNIVKSIIMTESGLNKKVTSSCDCQGLMQVNAHYNSGNLYNVDTNLDAGCKIFKHALDTFGGDVNKAIMAYNTGEANIKKGKLNQTYLKKVLGYYNQLKNGSQYTISSSKKLDVNA